MVLGILHRVLGLLHRVLGVLHRLLGVHLGPAGCTMVFPRLSLEHMSPYA